MAPLLAAGLSDLGLRRARNEDALLLEPAHGLAVVADGMGGHPAGDVASALAAAEMRAYWTAAPADAVTDAEGPSAPLAGSRSPLGRRMAEAVRCADARVRAAGAAHPERAGMGTTLTALLVDATDRRAVIGHVGDSRAYLYGSGGLRQLTRDHTWVQQQLDAGSISPGDARGHPWSHVLSQALGVGDPIACDLIERDVAEGEIFLLCTDGLTTMLTDEAIEHTLASALPNGLGAAARALVEGANERGGSDNITVALIALADR